MLPRGFAPLAGRIYPVWGADHYFRTREDPRPTLEQQLSMAVEPHRLDPFS
jgi:hypothetical protein